MRDLLFIAVSTLFILNIECSVWPKDDSLNTNETEAVIYLIETNVKLGEQLRILTEASWGYATNINDETAAAEIAAIEKFNDFQKNQSIETQKYDWSNFKQYNRRQFEKLAVIGTSALTGDDEITYTKVSNNMQTIYSSATICVNGKCDLQLDRDLTGIMANSKNYSELQEAWVNWRDASGKKMREDYITYYTLGNKAATLNKLPDQSFETLDELWLFVWETPDIKDQTANLWEKLKPFYQKLHAYVRLKLKAVFGDKMPKDNTIPAHLLGNMWAQQWSNIMNTVDGIDPYPDVTEIDVTKALENQGYTATKMFELSDQFFGDLGLDKMTSTFWNKSVLSEPDNITMVCHASAWDFFTEDDFRIKQCTKITMEDLITVHHEMGHIEYFM
jgi:peptidyl-dipeptidase A